jgi:YHS domain-containing protein
MIRSFFVEFVFPVLLFLVLRSLIASFLKGPARRSAPRPASQPMVSPGGELKKDPVCGTYVSTATSISRTVNGQKIYFCSKDCCEKYGAEVRR